MLSRKANKFIYYLEFSILGMIFWCVLNESFNLTNLLIGFVMGAFAVLFSDFFIVSKEHVRIYKINPFRITAYLGLLVFHIIVSGIKTIPIIITGKTNIGIIKLDLKSDESLTNTIIANSITMTPGTVTIDKDKDIITVLWIDVKTRDKTKAHKQIMGHFERILND